MTKRKPYFEREVQHAVVQEWFAETWMERWKGDPEDLKGQLQSRREEFPERVYRGVLEETRVTRTITVEQNEPGAPVKRRKKPDTMDPDTTEGSTDDSAASSGAEPQGEDQAQDG